MKIRYMTDREYITINDAYENNLQHVSLRIPKYKITVFTGVSGSGKSSLVQDTIAARSRRELNDTFPSFVQQYLPKYGRPHVGSIDNLPVAIVIDQKKPASNSRSTVATYTDIHPLLRLLFSRVGQPFVGYSDTFSFNHPQGSCPRCSGLGEIRELDIHKLVDFDKSLNDEDTIHYIAWLEVDTLCPQRSVRPGQEDTGLHSRGAGPVSVFAADTSEEPSLQLA